MRCSRLIITAFLVTQPFHGLAQTSKENADFKLAINLYNDKLYDLAADQLNQFIRTYPTTPQGTEARFYLGLTQLNLKQFDDARLTFQTFALSYQDNPKAPEAWWNVGESYAAIGNDKEAALAFERVKVFHPQTKIAADALVQASRYFSLAGESEKARRVLRMVLQEYGSSRSVPAARILLSRMYFGEGNLELAQNELKRVIEGDPPAETKAEALLLLGNVSEAMGRWDLAKRNYQEIISRFPSTAAVQGAYVSSGKLQAGGGKYQDAIDNFKKAVAIQTSMDSSRQHKITVREDQSLTQQAIIGIGDAYVSLRDHTNAIAFYEKFIGAYPQHEQSGEVLWKTAVESSRAKNYTKSNDACSQLLKSNAADALKRRAQIKLALNAQQQNRPVQAVQHYRAFLDEFPDDPASAEIVLRIATLSEQELHEPRTAISYYELLQARYPHSSFVPDAHAGAARNYEKLKEFSRALQLYQNLVSKFPSSPLRPLAEERIRQIETFDAKDKDAGMEKLTLLIGDVVTDKDKVGLSFRLGIIYFQDLKNYEAAAAQFTNVVNSGGDDGRVRDALFLRAKAYEYLSWRDKTYREQAIDASRNFLKAYHTDSKSEDAAFAVFTLNATTLTAAREAYASLLAIYPHHTQRDTMLLRIGIYQQEASAPDSALGTFRTILRQFPSSPSTEEATLRIMQIFMKMNKPDSVLALGMAYLKDYPNGPHAATVLESLGSLAMAKGDAAGAIQWYETLVNDFPESRDTDKFRHSLAEAYLSAGDNQKAIGVFLKLLDERSTNPLREEQVEPDVLFSLGKAYHAAGNSSEAKKYLFQFLTAERMRTQPTKPSASATGRPGQAQTSSGQAYNLLGMIYLREGAVGLATSYFRQASSISPGTGVNHETANLLFEKGEYAEAIEQFSKLSQSAQGDSDRQQFDSKIIVARLRGDQIQAADKDIASFIKKYRKADEDAATFELERGSFFFRKQDYANALKSFERVADKYDETAAAPAAMYWIGKTLEATNNPQKAVDQFAQLMKKYPGASILPRVYLALGNISYHAEKWDESIKNYKVIVDDPQADPSLLPFAISNLIETYEAAGIYDAALNLTRKSLDLYPNNEDSFDKKIKIGILYQRLGYNDQSVLHLQSLLDQAGSELEGELRYYIAEANFNKGDYQQAILDFLKVPYLVTKKGKIDWAATALYMSGQSYEKMGSYDQALTMYQQIVDRAGIEETFKAAAKKEIDRVKLVLKKTSN